MTNPAGKAERVAFAGGGNMAAALIEGLLRAGGAARDIVVLEIDAGRRELLANRFGVIACEGPDERLRRCDVIVLAVKPQQMKEVCAGLAPFLGRQLVLSIAAGIRAGDLARWLGTEVIVRAMPNTPALIGEGVSGLAALPAVSPGQRELAEKILRAAGTVVWMDREEDLDAVTAVSGSGPAYVFYFIEALIAAAQAEGLSPAQARALAIGTFTGAAQLAARSEDAVSVLRERVTSKGGTTAAALAQLDAEKVQTAIATAVRAARLRAVELGDEFGR